MEDSILNFKKFHLNEGILKKIKDKGYLQPTKIQNKSIPFILKGYNCIIQSATGSGKTFCYLSKILNSIIPGNGVQALIIAPTKDLVSQIKKEFDYFSDNGVSIVSTYGGVSYKSHLNEIYKADIIIGTTGRISDLIENGAFELGRIDTFVLDEVDEMLNKQFLLELKFIMSQIPKKSQKLVFSATISKDANKLIKHYIPDAKRISGQEYVNPKKLKQFIYEVETNNKFSLLSHLLDNNFISLGIIFCNRQDTAEWLYRNLKSRKDFEFRLVHGETPKGRRERTLNDFKNNKFDILITTDIIARGIDVEGISHIFNYNIPNNPDKYIHRIGRTARAGSDGVVINLVSEKEVGNFINTFKEHKINPILKEVPKFRIIENLKEFKRKKEKR